MTHIRREVSKSSESFKVFSTFLYSFQKAIKLSPIFDREHSYERVDLLLFVYKIPFPILGLSRLLDFSNSEEFSPPPAFPPPPPPPVTSSEAVPMETENKNSSNTSSSNMSVSEPNLTASEASAVSLLETFAAVARR